MSAPGQLALPLALPPEGADAEWLVRFLSGRDWITAGAILDELGMARTENHKRWLRALADGSGGRIAGQQRGYKLVRAMTGGEYNHWRNEWLKAVRAIEGRIVESDRVFHACQPLAA